MQSWKLLLNLRLDTLSSYKGGELRVAVGWRTLPAENLLKAT